MKTSNSTRATNRKSELSAAKRALLEKRLRGEFSAKAEVQIAPEHSADGTAPASFAQERLWFLEQLNPGDSTYNCIDTLRFDFPVDVAILERTLNEIVRRHESLRTTFRAVDGVPLQVIAPELKIPLPVVDLRDLPKVRREQEAQRLASEEALRPFDLERGPLVRATLLRMNEEDYLFLLTMHHIISDGWSMGVFWNELSAIWEAFGAGKPSPLAEPPLQYADFARWQRQYLQGPVLEKQLSYWKKRLADLPVLQLPTDRQRTAVQTFAGTTCPLTISKSLTKALNTLSQKEGATLFMTLLAAFQILLQRYSGQDDIVVGTYLAGRNRAELEGLIGFFINTLVMRTDLSGNPTFQQLLVRVKEMALGAFAHQDLPFAKLVQELQPERDLSRNPLFQVLFHLFNAPNTDLDSEPDPSGVEAQQESALFDLVVTLYETKGGLKGWVEFSTDLLDPSTIERMLAHYLNLLEGIVAHPDHRISDLPILSASECRQLLQDWNATTREYSGTADIVTLFEEQVERTPRAVALTCDVAEYSYERLERESNQLGHHLLAQGVERGSMVGVLLERTPELVVSLLAIFKVGAVYVPLDPSYPKERLAFMVEEARTAWLICRQNQAEKLAKTGARLVRLDSDHELIATQPDSRLALRPSRKDLAYVIFTSGSTGKPKGVAVEHKQILNRLSWMWEDYPFAPDEVCCQKTAVSFVDSLWELLGPLLKGVRTVVISDEVVRDPERMVQVLAQHGVSRIWLVPSFLRVMLDTDSDLQDRLPRLKFWVTTGETLPSELLRRFQQAMPQSVLYNLYGTSEVWDATWYVPEPDAASLWRVPIGRPISNVQAYVLDRCMQPVPIGVPGELYIGGDGLAREYLHQPEVTAAKFVADSFKINPSSDARLYKTGDLVRYRPDGNIEYIARLDHQIKIRGFRVELGEVESVLAQHPAVHQAAVVAREDIPGETQLAAYVIRDADDSSDDMQEDTASSAEWIPQWREVWDETYREEREADGPTFNISGFNSSYTGLPIPAAEVREWVDNAVERVLKLKPQDILEIGCGTGLVLFHLAPHCRRYCGVDFSAVALSYLKQQLTRMDLPQVRVFQGNADDLSQFESGSFDTVVLNSVVQYFPSVRYLVRVLENAMPLVRAGGAIFLGDVRSLPLMQAFHTSVELRRASPSSSLSELRGKVRERMVAEEELTIDPLFFFTLCERLPRIRGIQIELKRGHRANEFARFRQDVILRLDTANKEKEVVNPVELDWQKDKLTLEQLRNILAVNGPESAHVRCIPNARLSAEIQACELLFEEKPAFDKVSGLQQAVAEFSEDGSVEPEDLWRLQKELGYSIHLGWGGPGTERYFDALITRKDGAGIYNEEWYSIAARKPWSRYANNPLQGIFARKLVPELTRFLREHVPDHMVPSTFVVVEALPLTPTGKLDRRALPAPSRERPELLKSYTAPRTPVEEKLVQMYSEVLAISGVGIHDDFFTELRGHSLLATQLLSRLCDAFQIRLPLRTVFEHPTVAGLAQEVEKARKNIQQLRQPSITPLSREEHRMTVSPEKSVVPSAFSAAKSA